MTEHTTRIVSRIAGWAVLWFALFYTAVAVAPASWFGFHPGQVRFNDAPSGVSPIIEYTRTIDRAVWAKYRVTVRTARVDVSEIADGDAVFSDVVCEVNSLPFTYQPASGPLVGKSLTWWAPSDPRCDGLADGIYWVETCWFLLDPIGDLIRVAVPSFPKRVLGPLTSTKVICRDSNVFYIGPRPEAMQGAG